MDSLQALIKELYTSFLLRDFAGKMVPGAWLLFSVSSMLLGPSRVLKALASNSSTAIIFILAGLAWTLMLGVQGATVRLGIWQYYPSADSYQQPLSEIGPGSAQERVQRFLQVGCSTDKLQYERMVVIKEATGNLFSAICLSIPAWVCFLLIGMSDLKTKYGAMGEWQLALKACVFLAFIAFFLWGLRVMNAEHVGKQFDIVESTLKRVDSIKCTADDRLSAAGSKKE